MYGYDPNSNLMANGTRVMRADDLGHRGLIIAKGTIKSKSTTGNGYLVRWDAGWTTWIPLDKVRALNAIELLAECTTNTNNSSRSDKE